MSTPPNYCKIGFITKPKGLKGALRVSFEDFFIAYLAEEETEHIFVSIRGQLAPFFIEVIEDRQGLKIGCIEEIAYRQGFIDENQLLKLAKQYHKSGYGLYLEQILNA